MKALRVMDSGGWGKPERKRKYWRCIGGIKRKRQKIVQKRAGYL